MESPPSKIVRRQEKQKRRRQHKKEKLQAHAAFLSSQHSEVPVSVPLHNEQSSLSQAQRRRKHKKAKVEARRVFIEELPALNGKDFIAEAALPVFVRRPYSRDASAAIPKAAILSTTIQGQKARIFENGLTLMVKQGNELILGLSTCVGPTDVMDAVPEATIVRILCSSC